MKTNKILKETEVEFEELYKLHLNSIIRHVYHKVNNRQIAEDIAQETFYLAYVKWEQVRRSPAPLRWLYQTANYKVMELYRRASNYPTVSIDDAVDVAVSEEVSQQMSELEIIADDSLTKEEWLLVKKYFIIGYTVEELAKEMGITTNNLRVRLSRATSKLRKNMEV